MFGKKEKSRDDQQERGGFIKRLRARLNKGDSWLTYDLANLAPGGKIDEDVLEELESLLVMADVGAEGGLTLNEAFWIDFPEGYRSHQIRLEGGDCSTDSFCYPSV